MHIGPYSLANRLFVAPMAGVTDRPFRQLCKALGAGYAVSEMVTSRKDLWASLKTSRRADHAGEPGPIAVQIAGTDAAMIAEAAAYNIDRGAQIIDINMGCPARKVCNVAAGSALMADEPLALRIIETVAAAVPVPVTVKMRMGWDGNSLNFLELANLAAENGAKAIALHGRTGKISYHKPAQWQPITELKRAFQNLPIIGNGDVTTPADARRMLEETGCDAVMIGRAAKANPWIFSWHDREEVSIQEVAETTLWQLRDMLLTDPENAIMPFRKYLKAYLDPYQLPRETMRCLLTCSDPIELTDLVVETFSALGATVE